MTIDQIEMIEAIIECGSYQAAAEKLHKSQPSLSVGVKKIEEEFGLELFARDSYRSRLTETGRLFFAQAKETLRSFRQLEVLGRELAGEVEPSLKIAIDPLIPVRKIKKFLKIVLAEDIHIPITLETKALEDSVRVLTQQTHDFSIGHRFSSPPEIESRFFFRARLLPVVARKLLPQRNLTEEDLRSVPHVILRSQSDETPPSSDQERKCWYVSDHHLKEQLILNGCGWGRIEADQAKKECKTLRVIPPSLVKPLEMELFLMRHTLRPMGKIGRQIWQVGQS